MVVPAIPDMPTRGNPLNYWVLIPQAGQGVGARTMGVVRLVLLIRLSDQKFLAEAWQLEGLRLELLFQGAFRVSDCLEDMSNLIAGL